jgi:hypothetical protein
LSGEEFIKVTPAGARTPLAKKRRATAVGGQIGRFHFFKVPKNMEYPHVGRVYWLVVFAAFPEETPRVALE